MSPEFVLLIAGFCFVVIAFRCLSATIATIEHFSEQDKAEAQKIDNELKGLLTKIDENEQALTTNYVYLGLLLEQVRARKFWILYGAKSFGKWLTGLHGRVAKGRSQLYAVIGVAEKLVPLVGEEKLLQMGISKAQELKALVTAKPDRPIAKEVIDVAIDPEKTREDLRVAISEHHDVKPENAGTWRDLGGCYMTAEEWAELQHAFKVAERTDPPIPIAWPDWARRKEVMTRFAVEYVATYGPEVEAA